MTHRRTLSFAPFAPQNRKNYRCGCIAIKKRFKKKPFFTYKNKQYWFGLKYLTTTNRCRYHHNQKYRTKGLVGGM